MLTRLRCASPGQVTASEVRLQVSGPGLSSRLPRAGTIKDVPRLLLPAVLALAATLPAQGPFFPLKDVRAGMRGTGRTVFSGNRIDEFQIEVLGVLDNVGPKESLIVARLSGGPLDHTGVMQGMS